MPVVPGLTLLLLFTEKPKADAAGAVELLLPPNVNGFDWLSPNVVVGRVLV